MNALSLATNGYLCLCGAPLVSGVAPEISGDSDRPYVVVEKVSVPLSKVRSSPELKPISKKKRRK